MDHENQSDEDLLRFYLETHLGPQYKKNTEIIPKDDHPLIHISFDGNISHFYPRFSTRLFHKETKALPRLSTCPHLLGCIRGFGGFFADEGNGHLAPKNWLGLYHIYTTDYEYSAKPNRKLVPDVDYTNEQWILFYKPEVFKSKALKTGEFFIRECVKKFKNGYCDTDYLMFLRVTEPDGIWLNNEVLLKKGYYRIDIRNFKILSRHTLNEDLFVESVSERDYQHAFMLRKG